MSILGLWECADEEPECESCHSELTYDEVEAAGAPSRPLDFPAPTVYRCRRVDIRARDHRSGSVYFVRDVIMRSGIDRCGRRSDIAYLSRKKLGKTTYGSLRLCVVLRRISPSKTDLQESRQDAFEGDFVNWESTDEKVVMKISEWHKIHSMRGRHLEDPIKEISTLQMLGDYHPHVQGAREALQDDNNLYTIMPYLSGGDLYGKLVEHDILCPLGMILEEGNEFNGHVENRARFWFGQLLEAVFHLQMKGVCHRDISLENLLLDDNDNLVLIDPGLSLRVPYSDPRNYGCVSDVSCGGSRLLMKAQGQGGRLMYAPPEIINKKDYVDAFALDMWAVGVILFIMLVGRAPFKWAHPTDQRYEKMSSGELKSLLKLLDIRISPEASDLLQGFFHRDPRKRITLAEAMRHPWIQGKEFTHEETIPVPVPPAPKRFPFVRQDESPNSSPISFLRKSKGSQKRRLSPGAAMPFQVAAS